MDEKPSDPTEIEFSDRAKRDAFLTAEIGALRSEIESHIVERRKVESQTFLGLAAIFAWVLTRDPPLDPGYLKSALGVAVVISILGLARWAAIMIRIMTIGDYIRSIEAEFLSVDEGWETVLSRRRLQHPIRDRLEGWAEVFAWGLTVLGTAGSFVYSLIVF